MDQSTDYALDGWTIFPEANGTLLMEYQKKEAGINLGISDFSYYIRQQPGLKKYCFENEHEKEVMLARNFRRINEEVTQLTASLLGKENG